jgi:hypothetical protein
VGSVLHGDFGFHGFQNVFQNGLRITNGLSNAGMINNECVTR